MKPTGWQTGKPARKLTGKSAGKLTGKALRPETEHMRSQGQRLRRRPASIWTMRTRAILPMNMAFTIRRTTRSERWTVCWRSRGSSCGAAFIPAPRRRSGRILLTGWSPPRCRVTGSEKRSTVSTGIIRRCRACPLMIFGPSNPGTFSC